MGEVLKEEKEWTYFGEMGSQASITKMSGTGEEWYHFCVCDGLNSGENFSLSELEEVWNMLGKYIAEQKTSRGKEGE